MGADNQNGGFGQTPSQTIGPFFHHALCREQDADLVGPVRAGAIELFGVVIDGAGQPVADALVEIWQADGVGRYVSAEIAGGEPSRFTGFGRCATDPSGHYRFRTVLPGRVAAFDGGLQAAHIAMGVLGRGLLKRLVTRVYFEDGDGLDGDAVLASVPTGRTCTLIARRQPGAAAAYRFDIVLQGEHETVFFDC